MWGFLQWLLAAIFIGLLSTLLLMHLDIAENLKTAIAGASGYAAKDLLAALKPWVQKRLGL
jgi:hypothetical protein